MSRMSLRRLVLAPAVAALVTAAPALADQSKSVTATGTGTAKVVAKNRHKESSIENAVDAARKAAIPEALDQAREYARAYAQAAGLKLGPVIGISDAQNGSSGYYVGPFGGGFLGPLGPNQFCGIVPQPVFKNVGGKRKVVGTKRVRRCFVPPSVTTTLTVTYSAS